MNHDDYLALDFTDFTDLEGPIPFTRREFLETMGGGIFVFVSLGAKPLPQGRRGRGGFRPPTPADFNAFLRIGEDGRVTCFAGKIEMGQGIETSLAQMLADELEVPLASVDMVLGDTERCPWDMGTFGSMSTRFFGPALRKAAAEARTVLLDLAVERLAVPLERLRAENGAVADTKAKGRRVPYGDLTKGRKIARVVKRDAVLESAAEQTISGKATHRIDARAKVTGEAKYTADIRLPGMMHARILRPPAHGAVLRHADTSAAEKMPGVRVVRDGDLLAVLHETPDGAARALSLVKAQFDTPEAKVDDRSIFEHLLRSAPRGQVLDSGGDLEAGEKGAASLFEATYLNSYVAHAPIEPHAATARVEGGGERVEVWASTQIPFGCKEAVAGALGVPSEKVRVIVPYVGGGFGGKGSHPQAVEAARLARAAGCPVQVAWTRGEEFFFDTFRPAALVKIRSGLTPGGGIAFWDYGVFHAGSRGAGLFYDVPHHRTLVHGSGWRGSAGPHPFATGAWRAPANNTNTFARESHIHMLAAAAGRDPLEFRLAHLKDERMRRVLEAAAERFGWKPIRSPSGRGLGIACGIDAGSYVAHMAEAEVDRASGRVRVRRVVCAQDMGRVVNPEGARMQIEGCITMGLGYALAEEIRFQGGRILDLNFDTYEIPRFSWVPEIETVLVDSKGTPPQGGGEPAIICMGALVANAIHDAAGARLLQLPMTPERVAAALRAAAR